MIVKMTAVAYEAFEIAELTFHLTFSYELHKVVLQESVKTAVELTDFEPQFA